MAKKDINNSSNFDSQLYEDRIEFEGSHQRQTDLDLLNETIMKIKARTRKVDLMLILEHNEEDEFQHEEQIDFDTVHYSCRNCGLYSYF